MVKMIRKIVILFFVALTQIFLTNCSDRVETPIRGKDSTIVYLSKSVSGIGAKIIFCEKLSKRTGNLIGEGTVFPIKENEKVYTVIYLNNRELHKENELMFHIDWIDPSCNSFFKKRIDLSPNDSSSVFTSYINTSTDKRESGNYLLRVYLFRELIAEKKFELVSNKIGSKLAILKDSIRARITFGRKLSKKTGKIVGEDITFTIKKKANVYTLVKLENQDVINNQKMIFYLDWIGPDNSSFYKKKIEFSRGDTSSTLSSSISISPKKRQPGFYFLRVYLFKHLLGEKKFELTSTTP